MRHEFTLSINLNARNYHTEPNIILIDLKKKEKFSKRRKNKFGNSYRKKFLQESDKRKRVDTKRNDENLGERGKGIQAMVKKLIRPEYEI